MRASGRLVLLLVALACVCCRGAAGADVARWEREAARVTITRDDWGIPHVTGRTDADAVFGIMYAQAEDDFNRVETNYMNAMGRLAEAEGEAEIFRDLRMKIFIDPAAMKALYGASPPWLQQLMDAFADGLNYYLYRHLDTRPRVIDRFEPWMALTFSEGSIGGDIERVNLNQLEAFYGKTPASAPVALRRGEPEDPDRFVEPTGSNGVAIAPSRSASRHALLLINPHTSFFFRAEAQMTSDEGLNAYGALTWGQFFVYQGFNERSGWMHTSSGVDNIDEYLESVTKRGDGYTYRYGGADRPIAVSTISVPYKTAAGMAKRAFQVFRTHHGPVVREAGGQWVTVRLMQEPLKALQQSYMRTKARNYNAFKAAMAWHANSSNNTVYADGDGSIAYFHSNFIPRRDARFDWTKPVDGSDPATEWHDVLSIDETPGVLNPPSGWLYNSNNWPWSAAGPNSPKKADYPAYVDTAIEESPRGVHALRILDKTTGFTLTSLITAAYDSYLPAFDVLIPPLVQAYDQAPVSSPLKARVAEQMAVLRQWDYRWSASSVPTSLAVYWGEELGRLVGDAARQDGVPVDRYMARHATAEQRLRALASASDTLAADFGTWRTPWGEINRFQRLTGDIVQPFSDARASIPVGFVSSRWGSLASFGARAYDGTKKRYGTTGNSFVAVVEFGDTVRAKAVTAGGENSVPASRHFNDQAERYSTGDLREVYFYRDQLAGHTERVYHPGQ